jgi:hypothetical protein
MMNTNILKLIALALLITCSNASAQTGHDAQSDDGAGHYSIITSSNPGGVFTLPPGGGQILTFTPGASPAWLCGGNSSPSSNIIGTLSSTDIVIKTNNVTRATISTAPTSTIPLITFNNTTAGIQGVRIDGTRDAVAGNTLAGNPGVWDLVDSGDAVVSGIFKSGTGSMWFDGNSSTHAITADKPMEIRTTTTDPLLFSVFNSTKMVIASSGNVGVGTLNPVSPLHIVGNPPDPTFQNEGKLLVPDPFNHVLTVENLATNAKGNGIAIIIHNPKGTATVSGPNAVGVYNNNQTNYITFYNDNGDHDHIRGRIEGFSNKNFNDAATAFWDAVSGIVTNGDIYNPFNYFTCNIAYDPTWISFNANFMHFTPPSFPTLSGGSLPSISYSDITVGDCSVACHTFHYPSGIDWGSFPSISGGSVGSLSFDPPLTINGPPLTGLSNPFSVNNSFISTLATPLRNLPYKDKFIIALKLPMGPVGFAATYGTSFLGGITYESGSGDYAEWLERADHNEKIGFGDVVSVTGGKISKNTEGASELMVKSMNPCILGNMPDEGKGQYSEKIAFMGQVPVKMVGAVKQGDYIVPSGNNDGCAIAISPNGITAQNLDKVLGVAWEDAPEDGIKYVKVAVGLKHHEMISVIKDQSQRIKDLETKAGEIDALASELNEIKASLPTADQTKLSKKKTRQLTSSN